MQTLGPLIVDIAGTDLTPEEESVLRHPAIGGVILFTRNFKSMDQLTALVQRIKQLRSPCLMVSVDHEGGRVQRFREGFTVLPSLGSLGQRYEQDEKAARQLAYSAGWLMASELKAVGIDVSYAPVLDINRELNTVIGDRSFHEKAAVILDLADAYIAGMNEAGMLAIGKHFPGHGGVSEDSHIAVPVDFRDAATLAREDLLIFDILIRQQRLGAIMPAHVCYTQLDSMPPTFSTYWLKTVLRQQLGFKGLVISDDLSMEGAKMAGDYPSRVRLALASGCDMVLLCNHPHELNLVLAEQDIFWADLSAAIKPFTDNTQAISLPQLQKQSAWQLAFEHLQSSVEHVV